MNIIETKLLGHHNVAIGGATAIVHDYSSGSNAMTEDAVLAI